MGSGAAPPGAAMVGHDGVMGDALQQRWLAWKKREVTNARDLVVGVLCLVLAVGALIYPFIAARSRQGFLSGLGFAVVAAAMASVSLWAAKADEARTDREHDPRNEHL